MKNISKQNINIIITLYLIIIKITQAGSMSYRKTLEEANLEFFPDYNFDAIENRYPIETQNIVDDNSKTTVDNTRSFISIDKARKSFETNIIDGVPHFEIVESNAISNISKNIEEAYRILMSMRGVKSVYKRDKHWRTWREVKYPTYTIVQCYTCTNNENGNCGGYWKIEETPPKCLYEILSIQNNDKVCYYKFNSNNNTVNECNLSIFNLTKECGHIITTKWYFTIKYDDVSEKPYLPLICGGLDPCEITTIYEINSDQSKFKIINRTNDIIYSRVMRNNKRNWACVKDCGKVTDRLKAYMPKNDKPLLINLLEPPHKAKKREDISKFKKRKPSYEIKKEDHDKTKSAATLKIKSIANKHNQIVMTSDYRKKPICDVILRCKTIAKEDYSIDFSNYDNRDDFSTNPYYYNS